MKYAYCLDIGTNTIKFMGVDDKIVKKEKNAVAIKNKRELFAVGDRAYELYDRAPKNIEIIYPMKNAVIADYKHMSYMLEHVMDMKKAGFFDKQIILVAVPTDVTEVEKRAFYDMAKNISIKTNAVGLVEKSVADCVGIGIDVMNTQGTFIVNLGGDSTDFSVVAKGGVAYNKIGKTGGKFIDRYLDEYIKRKYKARLAKDDIEKLKIELGDALAHKEESKTLCGIDIVSGRPVTIEVTSNDVYRAIKLYLDYVISGIKKSYSKLQPEVRIPIRQTGIYFTGGLSQIPNLREYVKKRLGLKVHTYRNPDISIVKGLKKIYEEKDLNKLVFSINDK